MTGERPLSRHLTREVTLDELWESLAQDIHANGYSVRDALAAHRRAIEDEAAAPLREALLTAIEHAGEDCIHVDEWKRLALVSETTAVDGE